MFIGVQGSYAMLLINLDGENKSSSLLLCFGMCCNHTMDLKMIRKRGIFSLALARKMQGHLRWYYDVAQRFFFLTLICGLPILGSVSILKLP